MILMKIVDDFRRSEFLNDSKQCLPRVVIYFGMVFQRGDCKHSVNAQDLGKICVTSIFL